MVLGVIYALFQVPGAFMITMKRHEPNAQREDLELIQ